MAMDYFIKNLMNSNDNQVEESGLADKGGRKELDVEFRILEARLNLFISFSKLSNQLGIDVTDCVPFFRTNASDI